MLKKSEFRLKLLAVLIVLSIIPFVVLAVFYVKNSYAQKCEVLRQNMSISIMEGLDRYRKLEDDVYTKISFFSGYNKINDIINASEPLFLDELVQIRNEINSVVNAVFMGRNVEYISIYTTNKNAYSMSVIRKIDDTYDEFISKLPYDNRVYIRIETHSAEKFLCYYKKIYATTDYYNVIRCRISFNSLAECFENISKTDFGVVFLNEDDVIDIIGENGFNSEKDIVNSGNLYESISAKLLNGKIYAIVDNKEVNKVIIEELKKMITLFMCVIIILITCLYVALNYFSNGISMLITNIKYNDFSDAKERGFYNKEIKMVRDYIFELQEKLKAENEEKIYITSKALSERLSPHILYNSLSAIRKITDNRQSKECIDILVRYYRYIFSNSGEYVELKKELDMLESYIVLLSVSYNCNFKWNINSDLEVEHIKIPCNLIQPIVENAFVHGVNILEDETGKILIHVTGVNDKLQISIANTSVKPKTEVEKIQNGLKNQKNALGIIYKKLSLLYADEFKITICADLDMVKVSIEIPICRG